MADNDHGTDCTLAGQHRVKNMRIHWLGYGTLDAINSGLVHITRPASVQPVIARSGDIVIAENNCNIGGRALACAAARNISVFITSNGAAKVFSWLPVETTHQRLAQQVVASSTGYVCDAVAHWIVGQRFGKKLHPLDGVNAARGYEGAMVRGIYARLAAEYGVPWEGRKTTGKWAAQSPINKTLSLCNAALYGLTEVAVIYAGYSPFHGFLHGYSGKGLVYDVADMVKFEQITPLAFRIVADGRPNPEWRARAACVRMFRRCTLLRTLIGLTEDIMNVATDSLAVGPPRRRRKSLPRRMARH
ncbi:TPA: hypothetical protein JGU28_004424 [Salmonella enterica]|nr:hypothetical protein [Salmonella enterica]